ncbi:gliding motility-associated C-terminal domain-containing protein [Emticicia sp. BO119]|uniref:T9SS type B sorting domain-containing protein n=1 Tax=Emticicia sp. BO119 TaxID=2757768 RepID=UPI0015F11EB6|nr:gliding motility-associated C-terminal domain-containing protein [Emticicia sp. BO119]MBA4849255.1 gliding motility-associated C-terminal domain-containing protein [Emticicia sp. BO119]
MSRIKSYLLGFISLCTAITALGQQATEPQACKSINITSSGHTIGADFTISPQTGCLTDVNRNIGAQVNISNVVTPNGQTFISQSGTVNFFYDYTDAKAPLQFTGNVTPSTIFSTPGTYWIAINGKLLSSSTSYVTCKSVEVIDTHKLDIEYNFCDPYNVKITIKDTPNNREQQRVEIAWGDGTPAKVYDITTYPFSIDYNYGTTPPTLKPNVKGIYVRGSRNACKSDGLNLETTPSVAPKIVILEGLAGGKDNKITVKGGTEDVEFNIEMKPKGGSWTATGKKIKVTTANPTPSEIITVPTAYGEYCFRLQKDALCGASTTSDPICTINTSAQVLSPRKVKIDWNSESNANVTSYRVHYKAMPLNATNYVSVNPSPSPTFTYDALICSQKYEFYIEGYWGAGINRVQITSPPFPVDPDQGGKLPNALLSYASVGKDEVSINMYPNGEFYPKYHIYKAEGNSSNFEPLISLITNSYQDKAVELDKQQYCYKVAFEDDCGNESELSDPFCTIFLTSAQANTLSWTPFAVSDPTNMWYDRQQILYTIDIVNDQGIVLTPVDETFNTEYDVKDYLDRLLDDPLNNGRVIFRVLGRQVATLDIGNVPTPFPLSSYSNNYTFITPARLYLPTAFTPDGQGPEASEVFRANGKFISEFNMVIYNRWGAPIFETKNIDIGWDGKENGDPAPEGNYSYKIYGIDNAGQEFKKVGSVLLLR